MRLVCLLKAVTPAWVTNKVSFIIAIDYIHHSGSFEVLQAQVKCHLLVRPARPVPRALSKHYSARGGPITYLSCILLSVTRWTSWVSFMIFRSSDDYLHNVRGLITLDPCSSYARRRFPKRCANGLISYGLSIPYVIWLISCLADEFVGGST